MALYDLPALETLRPNRKLNDVNYVVCSSLKNIKYSKVITTDDIQINFDNPQNEISFSGKLIDDSVYSLQNESEEYPLENNTGIIKEPSKYMQLKTRRKNGEQYNKIEEIHQEKKRERKTKYTKRGRPPSIIKKVEEPNKNKKSIKRDDWKEYNQGQYKEFTQFNPCLASLVSTMNDTRKKNTGRPPIPYKDMIISSIIIAHYGVSGRRARGILHYAWKEGTISREPSPTSIWKFMNNGTLTLLLRMLLQTSATPFSVLENSLAVDSSGFRTTSYSDWFGEKHNVKKINDWLKLHILCGVKTNIVVNASVTEKDKGDNPQFLPLVKEVIKNFQVIELTGDKAYLARSNFNYCKKNGIQFFVPFKTNSLDKSKGSSEWIRMYDFFINHRDEFDKYYHKRSNVETTFFAIKSTSGETIRSKNRVTQENELYCKVIAYNIRKIIAVSEKYNLNLDFSKP